MFATTAMFLLGACAGQQSNVTFVIEPETNLEFSKSVRNDRS